MSTRIGNALSNRNGGSECEFQLASKPTGNPGDGLLVLIGWTNDTGQVPDAPLDPTNGAIWEYLGTGTGGAGALGEDTGPRYESAWFCPDADLMTANANFLIPGALQVSLGTIYRVRRADPAKAWELLTAFGGDTTAGAPYSAPMSGNPGGDAGDLVVWGSATIPSATLNATSVSGWTGSGVAAGTQRTSAASTTNGNVRHRVYDAALTGTPTATPTLVGDLDVTGASALVVVSERPAVTMVADASKATADPGEVVTLDSSGSTGVASGRTWSQPSGPAAPLSSASAVAPTFTVPPTTDGAELVFRVTDDTTGVYDEVTVTANPAVLFVKIGDTVLPAYETVVVP